MAFDMAQVGQGLLANPLFGMGIGLLQGAAPGGTFGGGAQQGLQNMMAMSQQNQMRQLRDLQQQRAAMEVSEIQRRQQQAEKMRGMQPFGAPAQSAIAAQTEPYMQGESELFPGEQPMGGLFSETQAAQPAQPATGLFADPSTAAVAPYLQQAYEADPMAVMNTMAGGAIESMFREPPGMPDKMQQIAGLKQMYPDMTDQQILDMVYPGPMNMTVDMATKLRSLPEQFQLEYSQDLGKRISSEAIQAPAQRRRMGRGKEFLKSLVRGGDPTGAWLPIKAEAARWLGTDPELVQGYQAFMNLSGEEVMATIEQTKGAVSEREMSYFEKINVGADKDPFTNFALMEIADRAAARQEDMARLYPRYMAENPETGGMGFEQWYMENHDPYPQFDLQQLRRQYATEIEGKAPASVDAQSWAEGAGYVDR
ncbi:MAG: hypothetical protein PVI97_00705 [Candidatus Thiodiazotropha sp.]|jgi:hypothetical protein